MVRERRKELGGSLPVVNNPWVGKWIEGMLNFVGEKESPFLLGNQYVGANIDVSRLVRRFNRACIAEGSDFSVFDVADVGDKECVYVDHVLLIVTGKQI